MKMIAPAGSTGVGIGKKFYETVKGIVDVPLQYVEHLFAHGFKIAEDEVAKLEGHTGKKVPAGKSAPVSDAKPAAAKKATGKRAAKKAPAKDSTKADSGSATS